MSQANVASGGDSVEDVDQAQEIVQVSVPHIHNRCIVITRTPTPPFSIFVVLGRVCARESVGGTVANLSAFTLVLAFRHRCCDVCLLIRHLNRVAQQAEARKPLYDAVVERTGVGGYRSLVHSLVVVAALGSGPADSAEGKVALGERCKAALEGVREGREWVKCTGLLLMYQKCVVVFFVSVTAIGARSPRQMSLPWSELLITQAQAHTYTHTRARAHTHTHTHTHARTHTHKCAKQQSR
jgi:hypothetical protein